MQPRRLAQRLEVMRVLMRILAAHHLEAFQTEIREILAIFACRLLRLSQPFGRHDG
jgi:hypothetical protein